MRQIYLLMLLLAGSSAFAQKQIMLKDANPFGSGYPSNTIHFNNLMYFGANTDNDQDHRGLWKTDGTPGGTVLVKASSSIDFYPSQMTKSGNKIFFSNILNGGNDDELWVSDGTTIGTMRVKKANFFGNDGIRNMTDVNGKIFYTANDGQNGPELWTSNGTEVGTVMVKDILTDPGVGSYPGNLVVLNNKLYFSATNNAYKLELWTSDGTTVGTTMVKNFNAYAGATIEGITVWNGKIYFFLQHNTGFDLWVSDGTGAGTVRIKQFATGLTADYGYAIFVDYNSRLYFMADATSTGGEVWSTDGTTVGTTILKDITTATYFLGNYPVGTVNGKLVIVAFDDVKGQELFVSDGTASGTTLLKDINPNGDSDPDGNYFARNVKMYNNRMYFTASDGTNGSEMYSTDGTASGTYKHTPAGLPYLNAANYIQDTFKNSLYFSGEYDGRGIELYQFTDSTFLTGVKSISNGVEPIGLYPNPTRTEVTVSYTLQAQGECAITITDVAGKTVYSETKMQGVGKHNQLIQLPATIAPGVYQVRITHTQNTATLKLVVQ
jgi:ELWxxDGT repeat protein